MNNQPIPSVLNHADAHASLTGIWDGLDRIDRYWTPPVFPTSTDASTVNGSETSEPPQTHEAEQNEPSPPITPVELRGRHEGPVVYGKVKKRLTFARYNIIKALLEADGNLSMYELDRKSGHTDARKILKSMAKQDEDWARAIIMPEGPGTGFGICKLPPT